MTRERFRGALSARLRTALLGILAGYMAGSFRRSLKDGRGCSR